MATYEVRDMRVRIRGRYFKMTFERLPRTHDGICNYADRQVKIRKTLRGERQLEVIIHELLHAAHWDLDETAVTETAEDLARILWRLGYRRSTSLS
jgi:hypothetical protein